MLETGRVSNHVLQTSMQIHNYKLAFPFVTPVQVCMRIQSRTYALDNVQFLIEDLRQIIPVYLTVQPSSISMM